jgi:urea transport system substrate-binding protein
MQSILNVPAPWQSVLRRVALTTAMTAVVLAAFLSSGVSPMHAAEPVKVGVLHSLSGTMAISETPLKEVILMAIEEINANGGVLGRQVEPVVEDPASNWDLFAEKAKKLLLQDKVTAVFGCWTSVSRKSVLPVFEQYNGLLFYPVQYEGEESSRNVFYNAPRSWSATSPATTP